MSKVAEYFLPHEYTLKGLPGNIHRDCSPDYSSPQLPHPGRPTFSLKKPWDQICLHKETEYQPYEPENNAPESLTCVDCGEDLELPGEEY